MIDKMVLMSIRRYLELWVFNIERYANKKRSDHWLKTLSLAGAPNGSLVVDSFNLFTIIPDETDLGKLKRENPTKYSIRKTQDTPLNPKEREQEQRKEDILKAINKTCYDKRQNWLVSWKSPVRSQLTRLFFLFLFLSLLFSSFLIYKGNALHHTAATAGNGCFMGYLFSYRFRLS